MATFYVNNTNDDGAGSLRQAIEEANATVGADTIAFRGNVLIDNDVDTITLTSGALHITDDLTINGPGADKVIIESGRNNFDRIFLIDDGNLADKSTVTLRGLTITGGLPLPISTLGANGAGIYSNENLQILDSAITGNVAAFNGGGIFSNRGTLAIDNSVISNNFASRGSGGGIVHSPTDLAIITNSTISGNLAGEHGGGIFQASSGSGDGQVLIVTGSTITGNRAGIDRRAGGNGGGLYVGIDAGTTVSINTTAITGNLDNTASDGTFPNVFGAIEVDGNNPLRLEAENADDIVNYRRETIAIASGSQVLSFVGRASDETGSASFDLGQTLGTYDIIVGTFDELDGEARLVVKLDDAETGTIRELGTIELNGDSSSRLANSATFITPTVASEVDLTPADRIIVEAAEDGNEHARLDYIELVPVVEPIRLEAEDADDIVNYRRETIDVASGNKVLSFVGRASDETGSASFGFDESAGIYNIIVGAFDENDGLAHFAIELNDAETNVTSEIGRLDLNSNFGSNLANAETFIETTVSLGVSLTPGDRITVKGFENASEHARLDYIELVPVDM